jgi:hypothetical protein
MTRLNIRGYRANHEPAILFFLLLFLIAFSVSCGSSSPPNCALAMALDVAPPTATADHLAASPGNQIQFVAADHTPAGCPPTPAPLRTDLKWTVSDPINVTIGNTQGVDYGLAKCINATAGAVTVTASGLNIQNATITGTATLTCK